MVHHVNVFEIEGDGGLYIEYHNSKELEVISYDGSESNEELMEIIRRTLGAAGVSWSYHILPEGDESPWSAPFTINQLQHGEYDYIEDYFQLNWSKVGDAIDYLNDNAASGIYQVVNRFGHAVGEEVII